LNKPIQKEKMKRYSFFAIVISFILLAACQPAAQPTNAPLATLAPSPTVAEEGFRDFAASNECCVGVAVTAGRYRLPAWFDLTLFIDVPANWRALRLDLREVISLVRGETETGDASQWFAFFALDNPESEEQFQADLLSSTELIIIEDPVDVTFAGYSGWQVDTLALINPEMEANPEEGIVAGTQHIAVVENYLTSPWVTSSPEALTRFIVLHIEDKVLVFVIESPVDGWEEFLADSEAILNSLELAE
jgi:hypothetical protein